MIRLRQSQWVDLVGKPSWSVYRVGRKAKDPLLESARHYENRISKTQDITVNILKPSAPEKEASDFMRRLQPHDYLIALDEHGPLHTTAGWSKHLHHLNDKNPDRLVFLIGGDDGHHPTLLKQAHETLGLAKFTLPHRLALVILLEQLYRIEQVRMGTPYHRR